MSVVSYLPVPSLVHISNAASEITICIAIDSMRCGWHDAKIYLADEMRHFRIAAYLLSLILRYDAVL